MRYRKKPVVVEAMQINCDDLMDVETWLIAGNARFQWHTDDFGVSTLEGWMRGKYGDWIIKGVKGEFYICRADIFTETYEEA